jgi:beta-galactosidase
MIRIGAQYYRPPNPPRADWARDLRAMRDNGFTAVKLWACWSWMAAGDRVDFADLDELMDLAADCDLGVVVNTILENAPYRLEQAFPEARYVDNDGRPMHLGAAMNTPGGGWPGFCFDNVPVWESAAGFLRQLAVRYRNHPALRTWDVWNEPHLEPASYHPDRMYCYCPASLAAFVHWLRARYGSLDDINDAWSRRFTEWSQVGPPRQFEAVPDMLDWREFWFDNLASWLRRRVDTVRAVDPGHEIMTHVALSGFTGQMATHTLDEYTLTSSVDAFGTSSFPTWLMADDHVEHLFNLDTARGASAGRPFWQSELQGGRGRRSGYASTPHPAPDTVALWMWNAVASGAQGLMFWQWRPELLGPEAPGYGLCAPDGSATNRLRAARRFAMSPELTALDGWTPVPPRVGLLVSRSSALHAYATDRTMDVYRDGVLGAYRMFADQDIAIEVLHAETVASAGVPPAIETIYWPLPSVADTALVQALDAFVRRGGVLAAEAAPGEYDTRGRRRTRVPAAGLDDLFGAHEYDSDVVGAPVVNLNAGPRVLGAWQREQLFVDAAEVIARFDDGAPAITRNRRDGGQAILIATYPSLHYHRTRDVESVVALAALLPGIADIDKPRWREPRPGLVSRVGVRADRSRVIVAINWTFEEAELILRDGPTVTIARRSGTAVAADANFGS